MKGSVCLLLVVLFLCILIAGIPAEAAHAGSSYSGDYGSSGSTSAGTRETAPGDSDHSESLSISERSSDTVTKDGNGITEDMSDSGNSLGAAAVGGDSSRTTAGVADYNAMAGSTHGNPDPGSDGGTSNDGRPDDAGESPAGFEGSQSGFVPDSGTESPSRTAMNGQDDTGRRSYDPGEQGSKFQGTLETHGLSASVQGNQAALYEGVGIRPGQNDGNGYTLLMSSSASGLGIFRTTFGDYAGYSTNRESRQGPWPQRQQQGSPAQPGQYPCGPAQAMPLPVAQDGPSRKDSKEENNTRSRSKRVRFLSTSIEPEIRATPSSPGLSLFPFSLLLFGGYRRISKKNILLQNARQTIYTAITAYPGTDVKNLAGITRINENTLRYHLAKLVETGKVTYLARSGVVRFFPNQGAYSTCEQVMIHYLRTETSGKVLMLIYNHPGLTRQQISDSLGISGPSVTRHMGHLIEDQVVENRFPGRSNHYYLTEEATSAIERLTPGIMRNEEAPWLPSSIAQEKNTVSLATYPPEMPRIPGM
ncbi:MAG: winged helix-turn-helix transcriptional regulator [Methanoregulaceae archaeon]|nr:winged helix-turn-helix transcriptional regulator [Methanoregulaceae archaeon]